MCTLGKESKRLIKEKTAQNTSGKGFKPNIWYLLSAVGMGGAEKRFIKMASEIAKKGWFDEINIVLNKEVYLSYLKDSECCDKIQGKDLKIHIYENYSKKFPSNRFQVKINKKIYRFVKSNKLKQLLYKYFSWYAVLKKLIPENDILHAVYGDPAQNGAILLANKRCNKCILEVTSPRDISKRKYEQYSSLIDRLSSNQFTILCVSKVVYNVFKELLSRENSQNWKLDFYRGPLLEEGVGIKDVNKIPKNNTIVFAHRFISAKNGVLFAKVIASVINKAEMINWRVLFLGKGSEEESIKKILQEKIRENIVEVRWSDNLDQELKKSKIFVSIISTGNIPSQSLFTSMKYGDLLLLSDTGNTKEIVGEHNGIVYSEINPNSLRENLLYLVDICNLNKITSYQEEVLKSYSHIIDNQDYFSVLEEIYR